MEESLEEEERREDGYYLKVHFRIEWRDHPTHSYNPTWFRWQFRELGRFEKFK